jgi:flagellar hook protein FlgE
MPFRIALSGLNASSADLRVIGNNVANASTTGFKESRAQFSDIFATSSLGTTANAIGAGVRVSSVSQQFTQGNIGFTDNNLDLAISGQGFFRLDDNGVTVYSRAGQFGVDRDGYVVNSAGQQLTAFQADNSGNITGAIGNLQLDTSDISPSQTTSIEAGLNLDSSEDIPAAPVASTTLDVSGVLDADEAAAFSSAPATDTVYDEYGNSHTATIRFDKAVAANTWDATLVVDGVDEETITLTFDGTAAGNLATIDGAPVGANPSIDFSEITFTGGATMTLSADLAGGLTEPTDGGGGDTLVALAEDGTGQAQGSFDEDDATSYNSSTSLTVYDSLGAAHLATMYFRKTGTPNVWEMYTFVDGVQVSDGPGAGTTDPNTLEFTASGTLQNIDGSPVPPNSLSTTTFTPTGGAAAMSVDIDMAGLTQYGSTFSVSTLAQDGYATGRLSGVDIADTGVITARFTNGQSRTLGQVALANFSNSQGLRQLGDTSWAETFESGAALVGAPGSGSLGLVESGALEGSNVDLTEQLVSMITSQRNFQANAQVITTADTVTQTIINIR